MEKWSEEQVEQAKRDVETEWETIRSIDEELAACKKRIAELGEKRSQHTVDKQKKERTLFSQGWWLTEDGWSDLNNKWRKVK